MKKEVIVREGCLRVGHAAVVTLTTKETTEGDSSGRAVQNCTMSGDTGYKMSRDHYSYMNFVEGRALSLRNLGNHPFL